MTPGNMRIARLGNFHYSMTRSRFEDMPTTLTPAQTQLALDAVESMMGSTYDREILRQLHDLGLALGADYEPFVDDEEDE